MEKLESLPLVTIIIATFNGRELIMDCLKSIYQSNNAHFEAVIINNGSNDVTEDDVREFSSLKKGDCRVINLGKNSGFATANNIGVESSRGKYVFLLNNDTLLDPDCIHRLVTIMETDPTLGVIQPKLLNARHPPLIDSLGYNVDRAAWGVSIGHNRIDDGSYNKMQTISYGKGAALFCRRDVICQTGLFDPEFYFLSEDFDFCWRVWLLGFRIASVPDAKVFHKVSSTISLVSPRLRYYHQSKNLFATLLKNYSSSSLIPYFFLSCTTHFLYYLLLPRKESIGAVAGFADAVRWVLSNMKTILQKRFHVQRKIRRLPDRLVLSKMMSNRPLLIEAIFNHLR